MGGFGDAIKYLYEKFILRDLLSFITPGAIVVLTASLLFLPGQSLGQRLDILLQYSHDMYWLLYIPLFGLFFMVGFAVQCLGEFFGIIRFTPKGRSTWSQRLKIFSRSWAEPANAWWKEDDMKIVEFHEKTQGDKDKSEWAGQWRERRIITKQMCGNGFLAIVIAGIFLAVNCCPWSYANLCIVSLVAVLLLVSLFWGYRVFVLRQDTMTDTILHKTTNVN